jgi:hypothetical protein
VISALRDELLRAVSLQTVRDRLPARLQVQDPDDPAPAELLVSAWSGTVARVLARGPNLLAEDLELALEAAIAGVIVKLEQALYPEQLEAGGPRSYLVAEYLGLLEDVAKVSDRRGSASGSSSGGFSGSVPIGRPA